MGTAATSSAGQHAASARHGASETPVARCRQGGGHGVDKGVVTVSTRGGSRCRQGGGHGVPPLRSPAARCRQGCGAPKAPPARSRQGGGRIRHPRRQRHRVDKGVVQFGTQGTKGTVSTLKPLVPTASFRPPANDRVHSELVKGKRAACNFIIPPRMMTC